MRRPLVAVVLPVTATVAAAALSAATLAAPVHGATGSGDSLFPTAGNGGYDVGSYRVALSFHPRSGAVDARTLVRARTTRTLASFSLDLEGLHVHGVRVDGAPARFRRHGHELVVTPATAVRGRFRVLVRYGGVPRAHVDPDGSSEGWIATPDGATALDEPVGAMTWFPLDDTPRDKATYTFRVTAPSRLTVAANGRLVRRARHGGLTTWTWHEAVPMAGHLAMVSIGRYRTYHSWLTTLAGRRLPVWSFVGPRLGTQHAARALLPKVLRWGERRFGRYPMSSAGLVFHRTQVGYSLETQERPVFPGTVGTDTIVHELAHQWFGDAVTPRDWGDIWLNEGFATYAEWWWDGTHGGAGPATRFRALYDGHDASSSFWTPAPGALSDPADLFSGAVYDRGAMTLEALRERIGNAAFGSVLRTWAQHGRHGSTSELVALAELRSGLPLDDLFHDWLFTAGKPSGY